MSYRVTALSTEDVRQYRTGGGDYYGQPGEIMHSDGAFPCRYCLTDMPKGAAALLVAHRPFPIAAPYSEVGPVFICGEHCEPYGRVSELPEVVLSRRVVIRAYSRDHKMRYGHHEMVDGQQVDAAIRRLLADPDSDYLHIRSSLTGCYHWHIDREGPADGC